MLNDVQGRNKRRKMSTQATAEINTGYTVDSGSSRSLGDTGSAMGASGHPHPNTGGNPGCSVFRSLEYRSSLWAAQDHFCNYEQVKKRTMRLTRHAVCGAVQQAPELFVVGKRILC
ncbi:hypothetical protein D1Y84_16360 [Acidipila sp. EB88]|nr:hypothetical protein D1Y84_16360 [Acidipila sp. EB88]